MQLKDQVVLLTGASRGIGVSIAQELGRRGARVLLTARSAEGLAKTAALTQDAGGQATCLAGDITDPRFREALVAKAQAMGPLRALINNAGVEMPARFSEAELAQVDLQLAVNLQAPIHLTRLVLPAMIAQGQGAVVMVSSMSGKSPTPFNAIYTATKHGLNGFAASIRIELQQSGVHIGSVCPSFVAQAGMWKDTGLSAPAMMKEVPLDKVVQGTFQALNGAPEVLVTPTPVRPLLAIAQLFPRLDGWLLRKMGILEVLEQRAD